MKYSVAEQSYLRSSLLETPPLRPDSRHPGQFRPVESEIDFLPFTNGSARVRTADGSECIVGIKTKVVPQHTDLLDVSVTISGYKDSDTLPNSLAVALRQALAFCPELDAQLKLTPKHAYRLFVDCVVLSHTSHPLGLLSIAVYQALCATRLPLLISSSEESGMYEIPQFSDDWDRAVPLCADWSPPVLFLVAVVGDSVLLDPTSAEEQVAETALCLTWKNSQVAAPIRNVDVGSGKYVGAFLPSTVSRAYDLVESCAPQIVASFSS